MIGRDADVIDLAVGLSVVVVAVVALVAPRRLASVICFLVFGVLLAVLWALAGAPDVALAEAAIGAGVTGVLFVDTVTRGRVPADKSDLGRSWGAGVVLSVGAAAALAAALTPALWRAARPLGGTSVGLSEAVGQVLPETGVDYGVTGVLLNLRSYDTLLETAVLLIAALVVLSVSTPMATSGRRAVPPLQRAATRLLVPVLVLLAGWVLVAGSTRPGGAFQSGAVIAAVVLLLHLAARPVLLPGRSRSTALAAAGLFRFVLVAAVGPLLGGARLQLDPAWAGTLIVALESMLAVSIGASLALIALALRWEEPR